MLQNHSIYFNDVFPYLLIFTRILGALFTMPFFGEHFITHKVRILFALSISAVIAPIVMAKMPQTPTEPYLFFFYVAGELFIGVFIGTIAKFIFSAINVAGTIIGFQSGLMNAMVFNPSEASQSSLQATFLGLVAMVIIFTTDTHFLMLQEIIESYSAFSPGYVIKFNLLSHDMFEALARVASISMALGVQLSAPFIILSLLFFIGLGILNRLMPQMPVFFIAQPFQIFMSFVILLLVTASTISVFMDKFQDIISTVWETKAVGR